MNSIIPKNKKGKELDLEESVTCASQKKASELFKKANRKLLHPDQWHEMTGDLSATFSMQNDTGVLKEGSKICIDIPAPGLPAGNGHDWVAVDKIEYGIVKDADESIALRLRVTINPDKPAEGIAHFLAEAATSTFVIARNKNVVCASYHGRNEKPNRDNPGIVNKMRNTVIAAVALAGLSDLQWKFFLKGLLA